MNIILLGAPASGKGSQGAVIQKELGIPHISSGNIIRNHIANKTEIGLRVKEIISSGKLVDDETTINMMIGELKSENCKNGFVLDGFPRTLKQAEALSKVVKIDLVININVDENIAIARINGRRVCNHCNETYHISTLKNEFCPKCGEKLIIRDDDKVEVIKERLKVFKEQTYALVEYYRNQNLLRDVDGNVSIENTFEQIKKLLKKSEK